ncbi:MAG: hypothetical protein HQL27_09770, partial [Candidatus Omnitrophica bacterium]|nr:hypothetical protein [Candidatus Omnitrophota bacterium]
MRQVLILLIAISVIFSFACPSQAQIRNDMGIIGGKVTAIDIAKNSITIADNESGAKKSFNPKYGINPGLSV